MFGNSVKNDIWNFLNLMKWSDLKLEKIFNLKLEEIQLKKYIFLDIPSFSK